jgi:hypothetical protein
MFVKEVEDSNSDVLVFVKEVEDSNSDVLVYVSAMKCNMDSRTYWIILTNNVYI